MKCLRANTQENHDYFQIMALEQLLGYQPFVISKANLAYV